MIRYIKETFIENKEPRFKLPLPDFACLVKVYFPHIDRHYSYINDRFENIKVGDTVFVDGKLENKLGKVTEIARSFKFEPEKMRRIISVCDSDIKGSLFFLNKHVLSFEKSALSFNKMLSFYKPITDKVKTITVKNDNSNNIALKDYLKSDCAPPLPTAFDYEITNVVLLELDGIYAKAIVDDDYLHELEFEFKNDKIYNFSCDCYNSFNCEHKYATIRMLEFALKTINEKFANEHNKTNYFCLADKNRFMTDILKHKESVEIYFK